jgi:predicted Zn-dependent peptidase
MTCEPENTASNLQIMRKVYDQLQSNGVTGAELATAKSKVNSRLVLGSEKPRSRLFSVGGNWINRHEYRTIAADLASYNAVTVADIGKLLQTYPLTESTGIAIGPLSSID